MVRRSVRSGISSDTRWLLLAAAVVLSGAGPVRAAPLEVPVGPSRYDRLVEHVAHSSEWEQATFAQIAVEHMLYEQDDALVEARSTPVRGKRARRKRARWTSSAQRYADQLDAIALEISSGAVPVRVRRGPEGAVYVVYGGRLLVVGSINLGAPQVLERRILQSYCEEFECESLAWWGSEPHVNRVGPSGAVWSFGDRVSSFRTADGLHFEFADFADRARRQTVCLEVAGELRTLADLLLRAALAGYSIDWDALGFASNRPDLLVIDREGTFIKAGRMHLSRLPDLLATGRPWLRARLSGRAYEQVFAGAERMLEPVLQP